MRARWRRELDQNADAQTEAEWWAIVVGKTVGQPRKAETPIVIGSKVRRIDEPYVVLHVRELDVEGQLFAGTPKALCFNSFGHGKWMPLVDLEPAP